MAVVLVTGANGFIGRNLVPTLVDAGHDVRAMSRKQCKHPPGVRPVVVDDISSFGPWAQVCEGVDLAIHLAARVHVVKDFSADPLAEYRAVNVEGTRVLLEACTAHGVKQFIFLSSSSVFGRSTAQRVLSEESTPLPTDPYGISKLEAEDTVLRFSHRLRTAVLRPPMVYGPGCPGNFPRLLRLVKSGLPLPFGGLVSRRSVIFVDNLVDSILRMVRASEHSGTFLVSDDGSVTLPELVAMIADNLGQAARLFRAPQCALKLLGHLTTRSRDVDRLLEGHVLDITRICRDVGWHPPRTTPQGVERTVRSYAESLE